MARRHPRLPARHLKAAHQCGTRRVADGQPPIPMAQRRPEKTLISNPNGTAQNRRVGSVPPQRQKERVLLLLSKRGYAGDEMQEKICRRGRAELSPTYPLVHIISCRSSPAYHLLHILSCVSSLVHINSCLSSPAYHLSCISSPAYPLLHIISCISSPAYHLSCISTPAYHLLHIISHAYHLSCISSPACPLLHLALHSCALSYISCRLCICMLSYAGCAYVC